MKPTAPWLSALVALAAVPGIWAQEKEQNVGNLTGLYDRLPDCAVCVLSTMVSMFIKMLIHLI